MGIALARDLADRLLMAHLAQRRAKAEQTVLIAELAEHYVLPQGAEDVHGAQVADPLYEDVYPFGGPGAPLISEYAAPEIAALLAISRRKATILIEGAVHLKWQLPHLYERMERLQIDADRAVQASFAVSVLPPALAEVVIERWLRIQERYSWSGAFQKLAEFIAEVDPRKAVEEATQLEQRDVKIWSGSGVRPATAVAYVEATVDVVDGQLFDAALNQIAGLLAAEGDQSPAAVRRAKAFGVLSRPAYALALIQKGAHNPAPELPIEPVAEDGQPLHGTERYLPAGCAGHTCGTISVPLHQLQPKVNVEVVIEADAIGPDTVARVDQATLIATSSLAEVLDGKTVHLRPIIDLPSLPAEDQYRPSLAMRRAVLTRWQKEAFPFSNRNSSKLPLDHTDPFRRDGTPQQTNWRNLTPLGIRNHKAKTARIWLMVMDDEGHPVWQSPLGYSYRVTPYGTEPLVSLNRYGRHIERARKLARAG